MKITTPVQVRLTNGDVRRADVDDTFPFGDLVHYAGTANVWLDWSPWFGHIDGQPVRSADIVSGEYGSGVTFP